MDHNDIGPIRASTATDPVARWARLEAKSPTTADDLARRPPSPGRWEPPPPALEAFLATKPLWGEGF